MIACDGSVNQTERASPADEVSRCFCFGSLSHGTVLISELAVLQSSVDLFFLLKWFLSNHGHSLSVATTMTTDHEHGQRSKAMAWVQSHSDWNLRGPKLKYKKERMDYLSRPFG